MCVSGAVAGWIIVNRTWFSGCRSVLSRWRRGSAVRACASWSVFCGPQGGKFQCSSEAGPGKNSQMWLLSPCTLLACPGQSSLP